MLKGIVPVMVTPMDKNGVPDYEGHKSYIEFLLKYPLGGLWALGSAGENYLMSYQNRLKAAKMIVELVDGRVPIVLGASSVAMDDIYRIWDDLGDIDVYGFHILPGDNRMNHTALIRYFTALADKCPKPLWMYHNWWRSCPLPIETVRELSQHPNIAGIKAGGTNIAELIKFIDMEKDGFQAIGAGGGQVTPLLSMGYKAHTASPASCFPGIICKMFQLWKDGQTAKALELQIRFNRLWGKLPYPTENSETSAHEKGILEVLGVCKRHVSIQYRENTDEEIEVIRNLIPEFQKLESAY